jgi:hypothetical protein
MSRENGELIGDEVGEFLEVEVGEDGMAVGEFLRIRVRIDIGKPLMRGKMLEMGENMLPKWCPFEYEFLPDFCYTCGRIGHCERACAIKLKRGEQPQYGKWLKAAINRGGLAKSGVRSGEGRSFGGSGFGRRGSSYSFGAEKRLSGSDSDSWRKTDLVPNTSRGSDVDQRAGEKGGNEIISPQKLLSTERRSGVQMTPALEEAGLGKADGSGRKDVGGKGVLEIEEGRLSTDKMEAHHENESRPMLYGEAGGGTSITVPSLAKSPSSGRKGGVGEGPAEAKKKKSTFKRVVKEPRGSVSAELELPVETPAVLLGQKRGLDKELSGELGGVKRGRMECAGSEEGLPISLNAGLSEQSCKEQ